MDNLIMTVKNICAFVLLITVVDNLLSSDVYKKIHQIIYWDCPDYNDYKAAIRIA